MGATKAGEPAAAGAKAGAGAGGHADAGAATRHAGLGGASARVRQAALLLGFGSMWFYFYDVILYPGSSDYTIYAGRVVTLLSCVAALCLCAFACGRKREGAKAKGSRRLLPSLCYVVFAAVLSVGTGAAFFGTRLVLAGQLGTFAVGSFLSSAVFGFANGVCLFMFFQLLAPLDIRRTRFCVAASMAVGLGFNLAFIPLILTAPLAFGVAETVLAALTIPLYLLSRRSMGRVVKHSSAVQIEKAPLRISILRVSATLVLFGCMVGFGMRSFKEQYLSAPGVLMLVIALAGVLVLERWLRSHYKVADVLQCGKLCVLVAALSLVLQFMSEVGATASNMGLFISYVLFSATMIMFYAIVSNYQTAYDSSVLFALALASDVLGMSLGVGLHSLSPDGLVKSAVMFLSIALLMAAGMFLFNKQTLFPVDKAFEGQTDAKGQQIRCMQLADEHALTPRQKEILLLLANGERVNWIAEKLVLSPGTVRGHVNQVYRKLGVHSTTELKALVSQEPVKHVGQI